MKLGVNVDHIATIRQARFTPYPNLVEAVKLVEKAGADGITLHLREDRRHIQDSDLPALKEVITTKMNLEMAATSEMVEIAKRIRPEDCCVVPEKREELTTEGGLDVVRHFDWIRQCTQELRAADINVSLFIEPARDQIDAAAEAGANVVELHTGTYANYPEQEQHYFDLMDGLKHARSMGLIVNAGHGLDYENVKQIAAHRDFYELNIGHAIVARAIFVGIEQAVSEMKQLLEASEK
jgi:pyridoxine 5-phosphate synthase